MFRCDKVAEASMFRHKIQEPSYQDLADIKQISLNKQTNQSKVQIVYGMQTG